MVYVTDGDKIEQAHWHRGLDLASTIMHHAPLTHAHSSQLSAESALLAALQVHIYDLTLYFCGPSSV